ncbi:MAG: diguanylate cyclase, partial [Gammaproteobacteria bacterium]
LDGFGLLERIRNSRHPDIQDIPVIIITGANDSETTKVRASQAGATDFIGKPFDSVHLLARTQAHASARAVTQALQQETFSLEEQATTDTLSGLPNEIAFMDRGYQHLSYAIRHKTALAIFLVEIDDYPELVRQHGKSVNETIIRSVAQKLHAEVRQEDMVARTGTARFGLLMPGINMAEVHNFSERLNKSISTSPVKQGKDRINLTISIGVATPDIRRDTRLDDLLAVAARRLTLARSQGGNQTVFTDSTGDAIEIHAPDFADQAASPFESVMELVAGASMRESEAGIRLQLEPQEMSADEPPAIECREVPDTEPLPGRFAGPVPGSEGAAYAAVEVENGMRGRTPFKGLTVQEPAVSQGKAVFAIDDSETGLDETIVITAPFGAYFPETHENTADSQSKHGSSRAADAPPATTPSQPAKPGDAAAESVEHEQAGADKPENQATQTETPRRRGFFRRLLGAFSHR